MDINNIRRRIFEIVEPDGGGDKASAIYDSFMLIAVVISLIPLAFKSQGKLFQIVDIITVTIFIIDYILRWITADFKLENEFIVSILRYPFTFMAVVDLISILPSITAMNNMFKLFRVFRMMKVVRVARTMRVFRVLKVARYSTSIEIIARVIDNSKEALIAVVSFALIYIMICAMVVFNIEPDTFHNFFDAVYWATVSLTTVGYGDIYPVSAIGKFFSMISSVFGIAIVALPSGIITAGYMEEMISLKNKEKKGN